MLTTGRHLALAGATRAAPAPRASGMLARSAPWAPPRAPRPPRRAAVACYASQQGGGGGSGDGKSWGEIAAEAAGVAKDVFGKVASGASAALQAITKPAAPPKPARPPPPQAPLAPPLFGNGLLGRALGGLVMNAAKGLSEQLAAAARETQNIYEAAAAAIEADSRVAAALGAVSVGPPVSQSSSSSSVNGRVTKRVVLVLPVTGAGGRLAQAQVVSTEGAGSVSSTDITVVLPGGESIRVTGGGGGGSGGGGGGGGKGYTQQSGDVIDAEYTEIK